MKLDLGCGTSPQLGYVGVDLPRESDPHPNSRGPCNPFIDESGIIRCDLACGFPWPFADDSVDELFCSHVIEHLPAQRIGTYAWVGESAHAPCVVHRLESSGFQDALLWFLDEAWRVAKPGAGFLLRWPALVDDRTKGWLPTAFLDPTHYRFIPVEQALYWNRAGRAALGVTHYRARCNWRVKHSSQRELQGGELPIIENEFVLQKEA